MWKKYFTHSCQDIGTKKLAEEEDLEIPYSY
jgi:hypothetical protein